MCQSKFHHNNHKQCIILYHANIANCVKLDLFGQCTCHIFRMMSSCYIMQAVMLILDLMYISLGNQEVTGNDNVSDGTSPEENPITCGELLLLILL